MIIIGDTNEDCNQISIIYQFIHQIKHNNSLPTAIMLFV